jgi:intracellular multiplication protein IcmL
VAEKKVPTKTQKPAPQKRSGSRKIFRLLLLLLLSVLLSLVLCITLFYCVTHPTPRSFYSTTVNNRISPLVALNQPNQSDPAILQWAGQAAVAAHSYNFVTYEKQLDATTKYFTKHGWGDFVSALVATNSIDSVIAKQLIVSAVSTAKPVILAKGEISGAYYWRVQIPILVTYQSPSDFSQERVVVTLLIRRIATSISAKGIGIDQFIVSTTEI